ncbi:Processive diacylglycerol beta-glucosyltransferase [subsurface metagenome]
MDQPYLHAVERGVPLHKKILIPYFMGGLGHFTLAHAIGCFLQKMKPEWEIRLFDPADELKDRVLNGLYKGLWKAFLKMPRAAKFFFIFDKFFPAVGFFINMHYLKSVIPKAMGFLVGYKPDLIMSTHWGCTHLFNLARNSLSFDMPLLYIFGEFGGKHRLINCGADIYFTISDEAHRALFELGIPEERIENINLILHPIFLKQNLSKQEARSKLRLPEDIFTVVVSLGGEGIGFSLSFISEFVQEVKNMQMLILTGRNSKMLTKINKDFNHERIIPFGYREDIELIIAAADILAGKPGTSYAMEAVKLEKPFIVTKIGAPNEIPNMNYIISNGFGWYTPKPMEFAELLKKIDSDPEFYASALDKLSKISKKNGAEEIAEYIVNLIG